MWEKGLNLVLIVLLFVYLFGLIRGIPYLILFVFLFDNIAPKFGYQRITDDDLNYVYASEVRNTNYSFTLEIDKIDFESFEKKVYQRLISAILRMRQIPVSYFGFYFWKEINIELARQQVKKENMHFEDEDSFFEYLGKLTNQLMKKGEPLFEFRLIEDYTEDTSMIIYRVQHAFGDGVSFASLLSTLNDDQFSIKSKKTLPSFGLWKRLVLAISSIFTLREVNKHIQDINTDENTKDIFRKNNKQITETRYAYTKTEISFEAIKKCYKRYEGMTFNDFALAIFGKSLYQYCKQEGVENFKHVRCTIPVSHKTMPTGYNNLFINNYLTLANIQLPLTDSIRSGYEKIKPYLNYILSPIIQTQLMNLEHLTPYAPKSFILNRFLEGNNGVHFSLSNFFLSDKPYVIDGKQVRKVRFFVKNFLGEGVRCYLFTYNNKITLAAGVIGECDFDGKKLIDPAMANFQEEIDSLHKQA